ncbi:hypothetical protein Lepto7376_1776 [[Leptolyngbya] sp. PCC 7376]|uniref:hypothetical protein n=1 Tax=[Leptolyngbya] sp. PCC 7376 TaxID=111781 RepID=UPI00029F2706|nr:hypothetical protein [[Leptolyngbya] sp. PCC 7376]AFY38108.1 hypothetical protein Lepto7376_1776 [[Leptolyngbya] sp. PCC 7376]
MSTHQDFFSTTDLTSADYCVFGVATCFVREEGEVKEVEIMEPIPSAAIEALLKGIPTSYKRACATTLGEVFTDNHIVIPRVLGDRLQTPDDLLERTAAAARTYKRRPEAKEHIAIGTTYEAFNFSTEKKRVLNQDNVVSTEDNVKQHSHTHKVL